MSTLPATTPISFEVFKSITNSNGLFETWTDIINKPSNTLPINDEILGTLIKGIEEITGDNVVFKNTANHNVFFFDDDLSVKNNKLMQDKWIMYLYQDYMLTLVTNSLDRFSAIDWSEVISASMNDQFVTKNDLQNALCVKELFYVSLALGQCKLIKDCAGEPKFNANQEMVYTPWKNLGFKFADIFQAQRRIRSKFSKGIRKEQTRFLTSQQLGLRLLGGLTANSASPLAYKDIKYTAQPYDILNETYGNTMYLGVDFLMSEFKNPLDGTTVNAGSETGNLTQPFFLGNLHGLLYFIESAQFFGHGQLVEENGRPLPNSRSETVWTWAWRMNAAVLPIYARFNVSFVDKIPVFPSWTDTEGTVHPALDMSKAADYNKFCNDLFLTQPKLYAAFLDGKSNLTQVQLDALWAKNTIEWAPANAVIAAQSSKAKAPNTPIL